MDSHPHRGGWARHGVALTLLSLAAGPAAALGLGRIATQSALGEPLRIEIEVSSITPEEASSLQVRIAGPEAYQAAGVEYNPILSSARAVLQRRPDGRTVLRLVSDRVVQEPFVELILDLAWSAGHLVRSYTLLIDPPATRTAAPSDSATPALVPGVNAALSSTPPSRAPAVRPAPLPAPPAPPPRRSAAAPSPSQSGMVSPPGSEFEPRSEARPAPGPRLADVRPAEGASPGRSAGTDRYLVRPGDTLAAIAARTRPSGVSLDQMLASLYRANSGAFIGNSIHRLRSGVVLNVPSADEARNLAPQQARQTIQAQSADFNAYRRGLAGAVGDDRPEDASRRASGSLQAAVDDRRRAAASSPDRLTLSKDASAAASFNDALASLQRERQDAEVRLSALMRNIEELKALAGQAAASAAVGSAASSQPVISPRPPAAASEPTVGIAPAASAPVASTPTAPAASAGLPGDVIATQALPTPTPVAPPAAVLPPRMLPAEVPPEPESFLASLIEESALPLALAALLLTGALLVGAQRLRRRRAGMQSETSFLDSSLKVDSFLGGAGNLPPDSRQMPVGALSSGYSLSQLDAGGDVDPVAEADVYLAYGRDLQAEEILKDAMRSDPDRLAIRTKLLEVYAKRRDTNGFEVLASQLHALTLGQGEDWELAQQLGRGIDAGNPLYAPGGAPRRDDVDFDGADDPLGPNTLPQVVLLGEGPSDADGDSPVDIELDFDLDEPAAGQPSLRASAAQPGELPPLDFGPTSAPSRGASTPVDGSRRRGFCSSGAKCPARRFARPFRPRHARSSGFHG